MARGCGLLHAVASVAAVAVAALAVWALSRSVGEAGVDGGPADGPLREWSGARAARGRSDNVNSSSAQGAGWLWDGVAEWPVEIELYSPEVAAPRAGGFCNAMPKRRASGAVSLPTVRAVPRRVVIDERCGPTVDHLDAGVCVQTDVGRGRRAVGCLPSLVIVGFQKCATAELQSWLSAHPALLRWQGNVDQRSGAGEPDFFKLHGATAAAVDAAWRERYLRAGLLLRRPSDAQAVYTFEKSPNYGSGMPRANVAQMRRLLPSARLIAMVREPAARAYSGFQHSCKKGRVFQIDADIPRTSRNASRRALRSALAGRVLLANSRAEAEEGLRWRFGTFSIYKEYIIPLEYPCPPATFGNFLGLDRAAHHGNAQQRDGAAAGAARSSFSSSPPLPARLTAEHLRESVLDFRDAAPASPPRPLPGGPPQGASPGGVNQHRGLTTVVSHGFYADHLGAFLEHYPREQLLVVFTEDLLSRTLGTLDDVQGFLGVPWFDYAPFLVRNSKGQSVPSFSVSKATVATHLPPPDRARAALLELYAPHNARLAAMLGDGRVDRFWGEAAVKPPPPPPPQQQQQTT